MFGSQKNILNRKNDDKCLKYAIVAVLNYENIANNPEKITNFEPYIWKYKWNKIQFPSGQKNCRRFETITL